jgi:predicted transcriptional regulator
MKQMKEDNGPIDTTAREGRKIMWQEERHQKIRAMLASFGQVSIERIVESFGISRQTVRRDLIEMEQSGILRRVRGGAVPIETEDMEFSVRITQRLNEKRAICVAALQLLKSHQTIFMDAGSTTTIMAEVLSGPTGLTRPDRRHQLSRSRHAACADAEQPGDRHSGATPARPRQM